MGTETVTVVQDRSRGDQVSITTKLGSAQAQNKLVYIEHRGLFLTSVTSPTVYCDLNPYALAVPSSLSIGQSWSVSYPCQVQTARGQEQWTVSVVERVEGSSVLMIGGMRTAVVDLLVHSSFSDSGGRSTQQIVARDELDPRSGLVVRQDETEAGELGAIALTMQFDRMP